jgi:hypothetical protein
MIKALIHINFLKMKKQILNLGKALSKVEQKLIHGGVSIFPTYYDDYCGQQGETGNIEGCPCSSDSNCLNMPYWTTTGTGEFETSGWVMRSGTCHSGSGVCVGA